MNITISKRAKSHNCLANLKAAGIDNQQADHPDCHKPFNKNPSLNTTLKYQQQAQCTKWLFQRCLRKTTNYNEVLLKDESIALKKTKAIHSISCSIAKKGAANIERENKINLISKKSKSLKKNGDYRIELVNSEIRSKQGNHKEKLTKFIYLNEEGSNHLDLKHRAQILASNTTSNQTSKQKIMAKLAELSLKPSTYISSNNNSFQKDKTPNKSKLNISNHFNSILQSDLKPFSINSVQYTPYEQLSSQDISNLCNKPISQEMHSDHLSRFQIVSPSDNEFKIVDPNTSNHSINTSYIRKKIQFSSDYSSRHKFQNYIYEPVYTINDDREDKDEAEVLKKSHTNCYSQLIKIVNVENEQEFNSPKMNSEESVVLEKGLDEIFNYSPTFNRITSSSQGNQLTEEEHSAEEDHLQRMFAHYQIKDEVLQNQS